MDKSDSMKIITGIYKITSPSGRVYIGQSWNIKKRWANHKGINGNTILNNSFKKYGVNCHVFEIVHELPFDVSQNTMDVYEQLYMGAYRDCGIDLLNIVEGGGGMKGFKHSPETRAKLSKLATGRIQTDEAKEKNRQSQLGRKHPEHVKEKIGAANRKSKRPDLAKYNKQVKSNMTGQKHSEETKIKIGLAHKGKAWSKGRIQSDEEKAKRSAIVKEWWAKRKDQQNLSA